MAPTVQRIMVQPIVSNQPGAGFKGWTVHQIRIGNVQKDIYSEEADASDCMNLIFRYLQQRSTVQIWLYEQLDTRIEGQIIGFDEFMNLVLDDASEVHIKKGTKKHIGRILLKGDNITLIQSVSAPDS
ncbi:hypothetical protein KVV02_006130 [Mortierella alpina]|uniref:Small nuclear ribonucleoprotein E n=1 Tax=Mortierella alpina TaxID=64518 RepID=A0A9P8D0Z9_MORAP|nr:hypothetical protein KVV02_006130 [Mortierella alpina]